MASGEIASLHPAGSSDRLRTSVLVLFACAFLCSHRSVALGALLYRHEMLADGQRRAETLAFVLGDHFARTISAIDTTLNQLSVHGGHAGAPGAANSEWPALIEAARAGLAGVSVIAVADETGIVRHATFRRSSASRARIPTSVPPPVERGQRRAVGGRAVPRKRPDNGSFHSAGKLTDPEANSPVRWWQHSSQSGCAAFTTTIDVGREGYISVLHPEMARTVSRTVFHGCDRQIGDGDNPLLARWKEASRVRLRACALRARRAGILQRLSHAPNPPLLVAVSLAEERDPRRLVARRSGRPPRIVAGFGILLMFAWRMITREIHARGEANRRIVKQAKELAIAMSKREEADAALRKNQAQFQSIMHHAPMMVSLKDRDGRYTFVNGRSRNSPAAAARACSARPPPSSTRRSSPEFIASPGPCRDRGPARDPARGHQPSPSMVRAPPCW